MVHWSPEDVGNDLRAARIREIEARMNDFLIEKNGIAENSTLQKVQSARDDVRKLSSKQ